MGLVLYIYLLLAVKFMVNESVNISVLCIRHGIETYLKPPTSTGPATRLKYSCTVRKKRCPKNWLTGESESVMFFFNL